MYVFMYIYIYTCICMYVLSRHHGVWWRPCPACMMALHEHHTHTHILFQNQQTLHVRIAFSCKKNQLPHALAAEILPCLWFRIGHRHAYPRWPVCAHSNHDYLFSLYVLTCDVSVALFWYACIPYVCMFMCCFRCMCCFYYVYVLFFMRMCCFYMYTYVQEHTKTMHTYVHEQNKTMHTYVHEQNKTMHTYVQEQNKIMHTCLHTHLPARIQPQ